MGGGGEGLDFLYLTSFLFRRLSLDQIIQRGNGNLRHLGSRGRHLSRSLLLEHAGLHQASQD